MSEKLDIKRFYLDKQVYLVCPECDHDEIRDFSQQYLSFPPINEVFRENCYCQECNHEWTIKLKLTVNLEVAL